MNASVNEVSVESLLERQDKQAERQDIQFQEVRSEIKELASSMKDLVNALTRQSSESRHTRSDVDRLESTVKDNTERLEQRLKDIEDEQDVQGELLREKKSNQKLIIVIYSTILASLFTMIGWLIGKA